MVRIQTPFSRSASLTLNKDLKLKRMTNHSGWNQRTLLLLYKINCLQRKSLKTSIWWSLFFYKFLCLGLHQYFVGNVLISRLFFLKNPDLITLKCIQFIIAPCYDHVISFFWMTSFVLLFYLTIVLFKNIFLVYHFNNGFVS